MILWFIFFGLIALIPAVLWVNGIRKRRPGQANMALTGAAAGEADLHTWIAALRSAGIRPHVVNVGHIPGRPDISSFV